MKTRLLSVVLVACLAWLWVACGPSVPVADPQNSASCPSGSELADAGGATCTPAGVSCKFSVAPRPCGAGTTSTDTITCHDNGDGGATWQTLLCL